MSETAKVRELPHVMNYIKGEVLDYGCGGDKITPTALGLDGRALPGVDIVVPDLEHPTGDLILELVHRFDVVYSSHFLEHTLNPREMVRMWYELLARNGKLVLYLPDGDYYSNEGNPEHMLDIKYKEFLFWFRRNFCGEGKNYKGEHLPKFFNIRTHGMDVGDDRYSFYVIAQVV